MLGAIYGLTMGVSILTGFLTRDDRVPMYGKTEIISTKDLLFIHMNRFLTACYIGHTIQLMTKWDQIFPSSARYTVTNTAGAFVGMFLVYDLLNYIFHRALHHPVFYPFIHKHRHRHAALRCSGCHKNTALAFFSLSGVFIWINHALDIVSVPCLVNVTDHDMHRHHYICIFGQYVMAWDTLCDTVQKGKALHDIERS